MKEIKAYIRRCCVDKVVEGLDEAGAPGISIFGVHSGGQDNKPDYFESSFEDGYKPDTNMDFVKVEVTCADHDVARLLQAIRNGCWTGSKGDGWIFVTEVTVGLRIRDGASGEQALVQKRQASRAA